jgi:hypothetical protein
MTALYCVPCAEIFFKHVTEAAVLAEREACAQAAEAAPVKTARQDTRDACAAAIRARGGV